MVCILIVTDFSELTVLPTHQAYENQVVNNNNTDHLNVNNVVLVVTLNLNELKFCFVRVTTLIKLR